MTNEIADPRLRAEVRAVEEGHYARWVNLHDDGVMEYLVTSDSEPGVAWRLLVSRRIGFWRFDCTCPAGKNRRLCKHSQLVARRLEREGCAELKGMSWVDPTYKPEVFEGDPFEGLV